MRAWVHAHTEEETLEPIGSGTVIHFESENLKTSDAFALTVLQTAYIFFEVERERRSDRAFAAYISRVEAGVYVPHTHLGYYPNTFIPDERSVVIRAMYRAVLLVLTCSDIADWMNQNGVATTRGNIFTARSVRNLLRNPVYCGDVVFRNAGRVIHDHHTGLVSRDVWEAVQERLTGRTAGHNITVDKAALNALFGMTVMANTSTAEVEREVRDDREVVEVAA